MEQSPIPPAYPCITFLDYAHRREKAGRRQGMGWGNLLLAAAAFAGALLYLL